MSKNLTIPKGTRDFNPEQVAKREYIFNTLKHVFSLYGFVPIETPSMEQLNTLLGKYGEEGDKLIFKILNSGNFIEGVSNEDWNEKNANKLSLKICEKGLRYDLTVPFARYVVMHQNEITFPFKRYQIQQVWRADKPQKGRYREFYQCDVDIIGSNSLLSELELLLIIKDVFTALNLKYQTIINNRKILQGIAEQNNIVEHFTSFSVILDKLDKIGFEKVKSELSQLPIKSEDFYKLTNFIFNFNQLSTNKDKINLLLEYINTDIGKKGVEEIIFIINNCEKLNIDNVAIDILLARGLNYYTGTILEVKSTETQIGSICGGGRYDNLTGIFGLPNVSGVGMSFGADRIYDVLEVLNKFPENIHQTIDIFIANFDINLETKLFEIANELRKNNLRVEVFHDSNVKLKKQLNIANQKQIPWVIMLGENEISQNKYLLKNMKTGEQFLLTLNEIIDKINNL